MRNHFSFFISHGEGTECFSSTARGAASLYVVGTYLRKEVKPPFGRFYEIKKRASARAGTASALFYYLYIRFAVVTSVGRCIPCYLSLSHASLRTAYRSLWLRYAVLRLYGIRRMK